MIGGQQLDLEGAPDLERVNRLKTGALFEASVMCGLHAAEVPTGEQAPWRRSRSSSGRCSSSSTTCSTETATVLRVGEEATRRLADDAADRARERLASIPAETSVLEGDRLRPRRADRVKAARKRLDVLLVERGLAESRAQAQALVLAGLVHGPLQARRAGAEDAPLEVEQLPPYVSRAGHKLANALDAFEIDVTGLDCLDVGASTGGFTDVLLQRGAARVIALDVGYGQLHPKLRNDPRVTVLERTNARSLTELPFAPQLVTCDVAFISARLALPPALRLAAPGWQALVLVKPQFEAGRAEGPKGCRARPRGPAPGRP
jgi:23S rRNA (cytidine1920-2'-O)/16S rRNA (cytidine1409-2'-O)-methyltransferase